MRDADQRQFLKCNWESKKAVKTGSSDVVHTSASFAPFRQGEWVGKLIHLTGPWKCSMLPPPICVAVESTSTIAGPSCDSSPHRYFLHKCQFGANARVLYDGSKFLTSDSYPVLWHEVPRILHCSGSERRWYIDIPISVHHTNRNGTLEGELTKVRPWARTRKCILESHVILLPFCWREGKAIWYCVLLIL